MTLWPSGLFAAPLLSSAMFQDVLRMASANVAAVFGVGNVFAGLVVALRPPTHG